MLKRIDSFTLECDRCGTNCEDGTSDFTIWSGADSALDAGYDNGWFVRAEPFDPEDVIPAEMIGKHFCPDCHNEVVDENYLTVYSVLPLPDPHLFERRPATHYSNPLGHYSRPPYPGECCRQVGCNLSYSHELHRGFCWIESCTCRGTEEHK